MNNGKLLLHPSSTPSELPARQQLAEHLNALGATQAPSPYHPEQLLPGERFLRLVTFMGCSPHIRLEPESPDDDGYCYLTLCGPHPFPLLRHGSNTRPPLCHHCRKPIVNGQHHDFSDALPCPKCGERNTLEQLDWKHNAGAARLFVEIHNIFPGEAIPTPEFLNDMSRLIRGRWDYFFLLQESDG